MVSVYLCAIFCIVALCASLYLHGACVSHGSFYPSICDNLRKTGTLLILGVAASMLTRVRDMDEILCMVLVVTVALPMLIVHPV